MEIDERLAQQAVALSDAIAGALLARGGDASPLQYVLTRAKIASAQALVQLIDADPADARMVMSLQNEAQLYGRMVGFLRDAFEGGLEKDGNLFKSIPYDDACELYRDVMAPVGADEGEAF